jgi:hypothetical protein
MSDKPLFEGMDERERELAPQQVPGEAMPDHERDRGGTAGSGAPHTESSASEPETGRANAPVAGADGDPETTPLVAVRPDLSANTPIMTPPTTGERTLGDDESPREIEG